jgi:divalent metal cation (Fe/Co/Zn/Cd) transporter
MADTREHGPKEAQAHGHGEADGDGDQHGHSHHDRDHHGHGHSHGLIDESIKRSREGIRAVSLSLAVLAVTAIAQTAVFALSRSIALLADLIHNYGDALTAGSLIASRIRLGAGRRLASPALVADGEHARADSYVSLAVIASAVLVALGAPVGDPLIGLAITLVILRITWQSWLTGRAGSHRH